jgi:hypothetical protein
MSYLISTFNSLLLVPILPTVKCTRFSWYYILLEGCAKVNINEDTFVKHEEEYLKMINISLNVDNSLHHYMI